ncbi:MAG: type II toxin-antitoxin system RelE/ParE family toxin [Thermodesulfovibrionales bacterium]|nr:type II toxin-antitoxin system RelE/ParE family toxin [Thermodesulfovibrionales bacterium]
MGKINWTEEAERWLRDIHDYIARDSSESAVRVVETIYEKAQLLGRFPEIGHRYDKIADRHVRTLLYGHYRIAYLIKSDGNIDILGVFHGALDIDRYLY